MEMVRNGGRLTLWRCATRAYIASERFLVPENDSLLFLVITASLGPHRAGDSALVLLSAIYPARVVTLKGMLISNEYCGCSTRKQESPTSRVADHLSTDESDAQIVARSGLSISGKDLWDSSRGKY